MQLKILSWNIWCDGDLELVSEFVEKTGADIIGLQEVVEENGVPVLPEFFKKHPEIEYKYAHAMHFVMNGKTYDMGEATFSKYPIISSRIHNLSESNNRIVLEANVKVGDDVLHVFNTHLLHTHQKPSDIQDQQAQNLVNFIPDQKSLLMGDFNATPESNAVQIVSKVLINTDPAMLPTWSVYPEGCLGHCVNGVVYKLDNIFVTKDIPFRSFTVGDSKASDHLPISVVIEA